MLASKPLGVIGTIMMADYAAVNGRCWKTTPSTGGAPTGGTPTGGTPTGGTPPCPPTWSQWQDKCYKMHDADVTWEEGKQICVAWGGVMVVPRFEGEMQHLDTMSSGQWFLIGCKDIQTEGLFTILEIMFNYDVVLMFTLFVDKIKNKMPHTVQGYR